MRRPPKPSSAEACPKSYASGAHYNSASRRRALCLLKGYDIGLGPCICGVLPFWRGSWASAGSLPFGRMFERRRGISASAGYLRLGRVLVRAARDDLRQR